MKIKEQINQLMTGRKALLEEASTLTSKDDGEFTEEDQARFDQIDEKVRSIDSKVGRLNRQIDWDRNAPAVAVYGEDGRAHAGEPKPKPASSGAAFEPSTRAYQPNAPQGEQPAQGSGYTPPGENLWHQHDRREDMPFNSLGDQLRAVSAAANGTFDPRLGKMAAPTGMGETVPSEGGFLVQMDFTSELIRRVYELGEVLQRVRQMSISGNSNGIRLNAIDETSRADGSRMGGVRGYWVDEAGALTASQFKWRKMELTLNKVGALVYATDELLSDTVALESLIRNEVPEELRFKVEDAIMNGDGSGKPKGFNVSGGGSPLITVAKETGQKASTILFENIVKMWARMWARSRRNAVWLINQEIEPQLMQMNMKVGTSGVPVYLPANNLAGSPFGVLMGRPVIPVEYASALGTAGDIQLVDLSQYVMIQKAGIQAAQSMHVRFVNSEQTFRFTWRVDGQPVWNSPLTPFKGSDTLSPFVRLANRS